MIPKMQPTLLTRRALLIINMFDLSALAILPGTTFLITHLAVHVAHWRLIRDTKVSRLVLAPPFLCLWCFCGQQSALGGRSA
jgi:hypothetical protein